MILQFLENRIKSFGYAFNGIFLVFRHETHAQIHLIALILVVSAGLYFDLSTTEWLAIIIVIGMVISCEIVNSSIEALVNLVSPDFNLQAGKVKDMAAGAVVICVIAAIVVGLLVFLPKIF